MAEKKADNGPENTVVSKEKLAAWEEVRKIWKATKPPHVTQELLDAEYEAANTD